MCEYCRVNFFLVFKYSFGLWIFSPRGNQFETMVYNIPFITYHMHHIIRLLWYNIVKLNELYVRFRRINLKSCSHSSSVSFCEMTVARLKISLFSWSDLDRLWIWFEDTDPCTILKRSWWNLASFIDRSFTMTINIIWV